MFKQKVTYANFESSCHLLTSYQSKQVQR